MDSQGNDNAHQKYLIGKLVTFGFKEISSNFTSLEGVVSGFATICNEQYAYMYTGNGEEFFVPLDNVAYMMISNKGVSSSELMKEQTEPMINKLPPESRPPVEGQEVEQDLSQPGAPSSEQLIESLSKLLKGKHNAAE